MPNIIPVPVVVSVGVSAERGATTKNFGSFRIVPYVTTRHGAMEIASWLHMNKAGEAEELVDVALFTLLPKKLLWHICRYTFETDPPKALQIVFTIDDESWSYPIRAQELEYEEVHYMVDVEGEWMRIGEIGLSDILTDDQLIYADREVRGAIDFGDQAAVFDEMN